MQQKVLMIIALLFFSATDTLAQDMLVATKVSQKASVMQRIGTTDVTVTYSSPLAKGRKIFGGIVPYNFVVEGVEYPWRAGSNENTTIEFSHDVTIQGSPLKKENTACTFLLKRKNGYLFFQIKMIVGVVLVTRRKKMLYG